MGTFSMSPTVSAPIFVALQVVAITQSRTTMSDMTGCLSAGTLLPSLLLRQMPSSPVSMPHFLISA